MSEKFASYSNSCSYGQNGAVRTSPVRQSVKIDWTPFIITVLAVVALVLAYLVFKPF